MEDYLKILEDSKEAMLRDLSSLMEVDSVAVYGEGNFPFGDKVQDVFLRSLEMGKRDGFSVENIDNYGGHIDFKGATDDIIAVVGHLDIVPTGDVSNWATDPLRMTIKNGKIYGRGAVDDKGPLVAAYYGMKALKEAGFQPKKTIRLIIGLDEETKWQGMDYYMDKVKANIVAGFSPDAMFPAIHGEKGVITFDLIKAFSEPTKKGLQLVSLEGGSVANAVCGRASCKISLDGKKDYLMERLKEYINHHDYEIQVIDSETCCEIIVKGISAHAAHPELGLNAISILFDILGNIEFNHKEINDFVTFYNEHIGFDYYGERIGMKLEDEPTGKLTFNVGVINVEDCQAKLTVNVRYPVTYPLEDVYKGLEDVVLKEGFKVERKDFLAPLYKAADDPLIKILMESYVKHTGDAEAKPFTIGGASYARAVPNTVAFGPVPKEKPDMCHKVDEYIEMEDFMRGAKIYADAIYNLAK